MKRLLLIDGDEFLFRATAAVEREVRWDEQNHVLYSNENEAWGNLTGMIRRIFERFETEDHILCFSEPPNFRLKVDPTYKNNRAASRKPLCYALLRERLSEHYKTKAMPGLEADDCMGILATKPGPKQRIIVSQDKDMKTIPTTVWDGKDLTHVTEGMADRWHLYQTLIGDTSDGYPGCPGVGAVGAQALFDDPFTWVPYEHSFKSGPRKGLTETRWKAEPTDDLWKGVVSFYERAGLTEEHALTQARLARILRWSDWDHVKKEPILWTPNAASPTAQLSSTPSLPTTTNEPL